MNRPHGNQHKSPKRSLVLILDAARRYLAAGDLLRARHRLSKFWRLRELVPASTRRRWKCGR